ncbi:hypothetical protein [Kosakonia sacchari]|uniref:hypothetical protein n=1 Tax=Kosakonia sacchari TaxID=1158459 RepID=UPI00158448C2|nr:hypothetical protein [Kosakonia sacchari]NUL35063.1 hypothetical protein [Kosakonia sacchari]
MLDNYTPAAKNLILCILLGCVALPAAFVLVLLHDSPARPANFAMPSFAAVSCDESGYVDTISHGILSADTLEKYGSKKGFCLVPVSDGWKVYAAQ